MSFGIQTPYPYRERHFSKRYHYRTFSRGVDTGFTARLEADLNQIAAGDLDWGMDSGNLYAVCQTKLSLPSSAFRDEYRT
jgi:hypothetical protein